MGAKNIIPLDNNGLSDPFVILELAPPAAFPHAPILKTKVAYKTLNPVYDETFELLHSIPIQREAMGCYKFAAKCRPSWPAWLCCI